MSDDPIKDVLRMIPYGFYSISSKAGNDLNIMVANWVTQVSYEPRLIAVGLQKTSRTHGLVSRGRVLALNLFRSVDEDSIMPYTKSTEKDPEKMAAASYTLAPKTGCPVPEGAAAYLECEVKEIIDIGGDHDVVIAAPVGAEVITPADVGEILNLPGLGWSYAG